MQDGDTGEPGWVFRPGDPGQKQEDAPEVGILAVAASAEPEAPEGPDEIPQGGPPADTVLPHIEWTASEYAANPKSTGWFMMLVLASFLTAAVIYFVTRDVVSTGVIALLGVIIGVFAARQPRVLTYGIDNKGIHIEQKLYPYGTFKTFSVADNQPVHYLSLTPLRRFMPPLVIHYDPEDEEKIVNTLAEYLPYQEYKRDVVDSLTRRFRF